MLSSLRKFAGSWVAMIFIGLLVLSFALFGINDIFTGGGARALAIVGDREISPEAYRAELQRRTNELSRQFGTTLSLDQVRALGLPQQTMERLINDAAISARAEAYGLSRSKEALAAEIVEGPAFRDASGRFDRGLFNQVLRSNGLNEATYVALESDVSQRAQLSYPVRANLPAPPPLEEALTRYRLEERTVRIVEIGEPAIEPVGEPDDATLAAYFEENRTRFAAPEYRSFTYIKIEPEDLASTVEVTEADLESAYEARREDFVTPERRTLRQIAFSNREEAEAAAARIAGGATFFDIAAEKGLSDADMALGTVRRDELIDPAIADAAFVLDEGAVSAPIEGQFSTVLVAVDAIEPGTEQPLDEVRDEVRQDVALRLARQSILDSYDAIEDGRAGGETLDEIAARLGLAAVKVDGIARDGTVAAGDAPEVPARNALLDAVFAAETDYEPDPLQTQEGYVFFHLNDVEEARDRTLDEVRDTVVAAWRADTTSDRLAALAREVVEETKGGAALADIAQARGLPIRDVGPFSRSRARGLPQAAVRQVFATPVGETVSAVAANGRDRIVLRVLDARMPDAPAEPQPDVGLGQDLLAQFVTAARSLVGVETNDALLRQTLGEL